MISPQGYLKIVAKAKTMNKASLREYIRHILKEKAEKHEWRPANRKELMLHKDGMEQSDKDNVEHYLKSLGLMETLAKK